MFPLTSIALALTVRHTPEFYSLWFQVFCLVTAKAAYHIIGHELRSTLRDLAGNFGSGPDQVRIDSGLCGPSLPTPFCPNWTRINRDFQKGAINLDCRLEPGKSNHFLKTILHHSLKDGTFATMR